MYRSSLEIKELIEAIKLVRIIQKNESILVGTWLVLIDVETDSVFN